MVNTGEELLQLTVIVSRPPIRVFVYDSWATPDAQAVARIPYLFDRECAAGSAAARLDTAAVQDSSSEL